MHRKTIVNSYSVEKYLNSDDIVLHLIFRNQNPDFFDLTLG